MMRRPPRGFTLIEVMMVIAILGVLAATAIPRYEKYLIGTKRVEAIVGLSAIAKAEKAFQTHSGHFSGSFDHIGIPIENATRLTPTSFKGQRYTYYLYQPWGQLSYYCVAVANLDGDPWPDVVTIDEGRP